MNTDSGEDKPALPRAPGGIDTAPSSGAESSEDFSDSETQLSPAPPSKRRRVESSSTSSDAPTERYTGDGARGTIDGAVAERSAALGATGAGTAAASSVSSDSPTFGVDLLLSVSQGDVPTLALAPRNAEPPGFDLDHRALLKMQGELARFSVTRARDEDYDAEDREARARIDWDQLLADTLRQYRSSLERCLSTGAHVPVTADGVALVQAYLQLTGMLGGGDETPPAAASQRLVFFSQPPFKTRSRFSTLAEELLNELGDRPTAADESLAAMALFRQVKERYDVRDFLTRVERTSRVMSWLVGLFPFLLALAGLRDKPSAASDSGAAVPSRQDLFPLLLASVRSTARANTILRRDSSLRVAAEEERKQEREELEAELANLRDELQTVKNDRSALREDLNSMREDRNRLQAVVAGEQERTQKAIRRAIASSTTVGEGQLERIYGNSWCYGRVMGRADDWYTLLRSAALGREQDVPSDILVSINSVESHPLPRADAPPMKGLKTYRPLANARASAASAAQGSAAAASSTVQPSAFERLKARGKVTKATSDSSSSPAAAAPSSPGGVATPARNERRPRARPTVHQRST